MSGSPIPRLITSMPAARLSAILRSSSANMYGGIASRRLEGSVRAMVSFVVARGWRPEGIGGLRLGSIYRTGAR